MTQHTKGRWEAMEDDDGHWIVVTDEIIVSDCSMIMFHDRKIDEANAKLIAEAGTVATECGLTPRQLLDQRNDLLEAAKHVLSSDNTEMSLELLEIAIKKAEASNV